MRVHKRLYDRLFRKSYRHRTSPRLQYMRDRSKKRLRQALRRLAKE